MVLLGAAASFGTGLALKPPFILTYLRLEKAVALPLWGCGSPASMQSPGPLDLALLLQDASSMPPFASLCGRMHEEEETPAWPVSAAASTV